MSLKERYKKWKEKRKEIARQRFGEWFFKMHRKEIDKMWKDIDLDVKDITISSSDKEIINTNKE